MPKPESAFDRRKNYGNGNRKELKMEKTIKAKINLSKHMPYIKEPTYIKLSDKGVERLSVAIKIKKSTSHDEEESQDDDSVDWSDD